MKTKNMICLMLTVAVLVTASTFAQRKTIAVGAVKITPATEQAAENDGTDLSLQRVTEAIDGQIINSLNGTRKFEVIARSDIDALMEENSLFGGVVTPGKANYLIVPSIDDFQDFVETATFDGIGKIATKRKIRLGMVARIYDMDNGGKLIESTNFQLDNKNIEQLLDHSVRNGSFSNELLRKIAEEMGSKIANRLVHVIYPAKVIALTRPQVQITINCGDGTGVERGQIWDVFALDEEMVDPDTGELLGDSEVKVGRFKIDRVTPKFSSGTLIENLGVTKGCIARPVE